MGRGNGEREWDEKKGGRDSEGGLGGGNERKEREEGGREEGEGAGHAPQHQTVSS